MQYFNLRRFTVLLVILSGTSTLLAADAELARHITVPTGWKGEQISLPPSFARERELLTYYQGLSRTIFNSRKAKVDTSGFSCELKKVVPVDPQKIYPEGLTEYSATVKWIEPFVTQKPQTLHLIIQVWSDKTTKDGYLFACVSPQEMKAEIWQSMRTIRDTFYRSLQK